MKDAFQPVSTPRRTAATAQPPDGDARVFDPGLVRVVQPLRFGPAWLRRRNSPNLGSPSPGPFCLLR